MKNKKAADLTSAQIVALVLAFIVLVTLLYVYRDKILKVIGVIDESSQCKNLNLEKKGECFIVTTCPNGWEVVDNVDCCYGCNTTQICCAMIKNQV
jgi:hypothetical protein